MSNMKLDINGHDYKISVLSDEKMEELHDNVGREGDDGLLWGYHRPITSDIFLRDGMASSKMKETLLHEVIHACLTSTGHSVHDEQQIQCLANSLHLMGVGDYLWKKAGKK